MANKKYAPAEVNSIELFAGAGGLAIGMAKAGFHHKAVVEWDHDACETFRQNQRNHSANTDDWHLFEGDAREFDYSPFLGKVDVISGGPPCQPFSMGGKHRGSADTRDMFPEAVRGVRTVQPKAFIFENVKGLLRASFGPYRDYIILQLEFPAVTRKLNESWSEHSDRLKKHKLAKKGKTEYVVKFRLLNAADYGVPQKRERVFFVGFRADSNIAWDFPDATHSRLELLRAKHVTGEYWDLHGVSRKDRQESMRQTGTPKNLGTESSALGRWRTVRDAIDGLPRPNAKAASAKLGIFNHKFMAGARQYAGHTGSHIDEPSKTLKAGDHGVPGGENMLLSIDGSVRYFTVREAARIQTFPDDYIFHGAWSECMRQLGNAVPVDLAKAVSGSVLAALKK